MSKRSGLMTFLSLLAGLALFVYVIRQTGWQELLARVRASGPGFSWIIVVSAVRPVVRGLAWLRCMHAADRQRISFFTIWRARLIGDAIGNLTTAGPIAAEPARLLFFSGRIPFAHAASSLSHELLSYLFSCLVMMLVGFALLLLSFALNDSLRLVSGIAVLMLLAMLLVIMLIFRVRWSTVTALRHAVRQLFGRNRFVAWLEQQFRHLYKLEQHIFDFYRRHPRDFMLVMFCQAAFHLSGVIEIYLMLRLINGQAGWLTAFILEAVNRLINILFAFVPVKVGVDEAGTGLLAEALGFGTITGVTLAIYRKLRVLFWTLLGLLFLALPQRHSNS